MAVIFPDRLYTVTTALLLAVFLAGLLAFRPSWAGPLWVSFLVLLVPFVLTNGILTGLHFWQYPLLNFDPSSVSNWIVWYDDAHNMGFRIMSIPIDDFLYAFLLVGFNVVLFEHFGKRGKEQERVCNA